MKTSTAAISTAEGDRDEGRDEGRDGAETVTCLRSFCRDYHIPMVRVLILTAQRNRGGTFASVVYDWDKSMFLPNFPQELETYNEIKLPGVRVTYKAAQIAHFNPGYAWARAASGSFPCCANMQPYKECVIAKDAQFEAFLKKSGHLPNVVFEVKVHITDGILLSTKYYQLIHNQVIEVHGEYNQKIHAFKNYICHRDGLRYAIDMYPAAPHASVYNYHHMRLYPYTQNKHLLPELLAIPAPIRYTGPHYTEEELMRARYFADDDEDNERDFTACSSDCDYCGHCSY